MTLAAHQTIEQALQAYVTGHPRLSPLIGARFYPNIVPQNPTVPYGRYERISTPRVSAHDGPGELAMPRFELNWIGGFRAQGLQGYGASVELAMIAREVLQDFRGIMMTIRVYRVEFDDERDLFDDDFKAIGRRQDVIIAHREVGPSWR